MINLLIVDDEIHLVDSLADTIDWQQIGVSQVYKAYSGQEAIQTMITEQIDIVVTDIRMPGMDGIELIGHIRKRWKLVKFALLTGYADFEYAKMALEQQVSAYLIKPVSDEEITGSIASMIEQLKEERDLAFSVQRAQVLVHENLPIIRHHLLNKLLHGRKYDLAKLEQDLSAYELPFRIGAPVALLAIRLEEGLASDEHAGQTLTDYAIGNIAEEIFGSRFALWMTKDSYDMLIFLITHEDSVEVPIQSSVREEFSELAVQVQFQVKSYLRGNISVVLGPTGHFPADIPGMYQSILGAIRKNVGLESSIFYSFTEMPEKNEMRYICSIYEHPTVPYLLEVGNWELIDKRVEVIFRELHDAGAASQEHLIEAFSFLLHAFTYICHKNGKSLAELTGETYEKVFTGTPLRSVNLLYEWTVDVLRKLRLDMDTDVRDTRIAFIQKAQEFIGENLQTDVTLPSIAEHVHLHPVYLSRIFKTITGETMSDYIHRLRMEKAAYLLKNTDMKVYEITEQIGYENPQYFSKVFRKNYGQSPLEYRDTHYKA